MIDWQARHLPKPSVINSLRRLIPRPLKDKIGSLVHPPTRYGADFSPDEILLCQSVETYTMTTPEAVVTLDRAVRYLISNRVEGAFVECGVWRGGSIMTVAYALMQMGALDRDLLLFDTFEGMPPPTDRDRDIYGRTAKAILATQSRIMDANSMWCLATEDDVRANMARTGYPDEHIHFVRGRVQDTLPARAPERIALLRLDTDWYESTLHELESCWHRLSRGAVLILDDYGLWLGQREAADEFFARLQTAPLLVRIDHKTRMAIKCCD